MSTLGERLKKARIQQRFTQDQLANRMNVTRSTISNWERGISEPSFDALLWKSATNSSAGSWALDEG